MHLPEQLLKSLEGIPGFEREAFIGVHESGQQITSIRFNAKKIANYCGANSIATFIPDSPFPIPEKVPWSQYGYYLSTRPSFTFDPFFHAGTYYVQEASSMFLEHAIRKTTGLSQPLKVLDLCAAPGGKSTHIASLISDDSLLVSNEVIKPRAGILRQNMMKWGNANVIVTNSDPKQFSALQGYFDLIVVDAPCSGSGLFRKEPEAINEWSPDNVALCSARQQRILEDVFPALKENGILIYATCSYSQEEDETIVDRLAQEYEVESIALEPDPAWNIVETRSPVTKSIAYRFYPDKLKGEGFFLACFRKLSPADSNRYKTARPDLLTAKEKNLLQPWMDINGLELLKQEQFVYAVPETLVTDLMILKKQLYVVAAGINSGELVRDKFIPAHGLAMSAALSQEVRKYELDYDDAISYLQRNEIPPPPATGWQWVSYKGFPLGWINALSNRVNNYYPKELRILKQENEAGNKK